MTTAQSVVEAPGAAAVNPVYRLVYRTVSYFGLMSIFGVLLFGFRPEPGADPRSYAFDLGLYLAFVAPHLLMTRSWFKKAVWGSPAGHPTERRFYILFTLVTWFAVVLLQRPLPGAELAVSPWFDTGLRFAGTMAFLACFLLFFQGVTFAMIDGLLGVPGAAGAYSHGAQTPLFTEGSYAQVRHPMYRAAVLAGLSSLLIHPSLAQIFWVALIGGTFVGFIPVEERQLIAARGEDYHKYRERTPYRLFPGIW